MLVEIHELVRRFPEIEFNLRNKLICVGLCRMLNKSSWDITSGRWGIFCCMTTSGAWLIQDASWNVDFPVYRSSANVFQNLLFSLLLFQNDWKRCISNLRRKGDLLSRSNLISPTVPVQLIVSSSFFVCFAYSRREQVSRESKCPVEIYRVLINYGRIHPKLSIFLIKII
jgi:hypothetical protein